MSHTILDTEEVVLPIRVKEVKHTIRCSLNNVNAKLPTRAYETDAGLDLYTPIDFKVVSGGQEKIDIGISLEIPRGYFGLIQAKSGLASKGINTIGNIIDSSYRGNIHCIITYNGVFLQEFKVGQKIAQLLILPCSLCELEVVDKSLLTETERSNSGFGSTGNGL